MIPAATLACCCLVPLGAPHARDVRTVRLARCGCLTEGHLLSFRAYLLVWGDAEPDWPGLYRDAQADWRLHRAVDRVARYTGLMADNERSGTDPSIMHPSCTEWPDNAVGFLFVMRRRARGLPDEPGPGERLPLESPAPPPCPLVRTR